MAFTSIEIIALVLIVISAIKMLVLLVKPMAWMDFAKSIYKKPIVAKIVGVILGGVVLYYLINSGMTIVQILAVTAFVAALFVIGLAGHVETFIKRYEKEIKAGKMWKEHWFYTLIWIVLLVWGALVLGGVL